MTEFFRVITSDQLIGLLGQFARLDPEVAVLDESLDRIVCGDVAAPEDLPQQARSTVDGYAVRAEDTFGASDSIPALLELAASIPMGTVPGFLLRPGQAAQIPTGGFLPQGADAVVMVEYTAPAGSDAIEVTRPVTVRSNVLERGEDARCSDCVLCTGKRMRAQEIGFLAALGVSQVPVFRRPAVGVISSGDEVLPVESRVAPGQIRDANGHAIAALVRASGGIPLPGGIVPDNAALLSEALNRSLEEADVVAISGGSSVGARDLMLDAVGQLPGSTVLAHGIAIRPGKPTLLAVHRGKAIFGLPGHPVSALVVAQVFLAPFLRYLQGGALEKGPAGPRRPAVLATSVDSTIGLEEFVRVRLGDGTGKEPTAHPVFGKSGLLSTMVRANGMLVVPMNVEGYPRGETVPVVEL